MNRMERRGVNVVSAAVLAVFVLFAALGVATAGPPEDPGGWLQLAVNWAVFAAPSVLAARILWRAWWAQTGARLSTMDPLARLLATAVASLPADRADWGTAMTAELARCAVAGRGGGLPPAAPARRCSHRAATDRRSWRRRRSPRPWSSPLDWQSAMPCPGWGSSR
jgi:hypothetical protein